MELLLIIASVVDMTDNYRQCTCIYEYYR